MVAFMLEIFGSNLAVVPQNQDAAPNLEDLVYKIIVKGSAVTIEKLVNEDGTTLDKQAATSKICEELAQITYLKSGHQSIETPNGSPFSMISIDECRVDSYVKQQTITANLIQFNNKQLCRVYPKGSRVDSSNYSPQPGWLVGAHMVALNWQASGVPMWLNQGKFLANGNCGYVLKPPCLVYRSENFNTANGGTAASENNPNSTFSSLTVVVMAGRKLPETSTAGFNSHVGHQKVIEQESYVKAEKLAASAKGQATVTICTFGVDSDTIEIPFESKPITCSLQATFDAHITLPFKVSEMATVVLKCDVAKKSIGKSAVNLHLWNYALPAEAIRSGYRVIPVKNAYGVSSPFSTVLVRISHKNRKVMSQ